jgi:hypothetical protein
MTLPRTARAFRGMYGVTSDGVIADRRPRGLCAITLSKKAVARRGSPLAVSDLAMISHAPAPERPRRSRGASRKAVGAIFSA